MTEPSVIFVDDDPHIRQAIAQTLKLEDLPVSCYESAPSALGQIDAVVILRIRTEPAQRGPAGVVVL